MLGSIVHHNYPGSYWKNVLPLECNLDILRASPRYPHILRAPWEMDAADLQNDIWTWQIISHNSKMWGLLGKARETLWVLGTWRRDLTQTHTNTGKSEVESGWMSLTNSRLERIQPQQCDNWSLGISLSQAELRRWWVIMGRCVKILLVADSPLGMDGGHTEDKMDEMINRWVHGGHC